ncbi:MAG TPA: hypothetical protein PKO06_22455, partial [Candidatus Ozemobacteraceae bacterium]|nr:hypothetical protein [Candidatus Ozemobacteraceae bacterium]
MKVWLVILLLLGSVPVQACDDTLLALLTASDPNSEFSVSIRKLNAQIAALGAVLNESPDQDVSSLVEQLMTAWLEFSNRYNVNPPEIAREDPDWTGKMAEAAKRIGRISLLIDQKNRFQAHLECLQLSGYLARFFDIVTMSPLKRSFLKAAEKYIALDKACQMKDVPTLQAGLVDLETFLATYTPMLATATRASFEKTLTALRDVRGTLASTTDAAWADATQLKIDAARNQFQQFRARLLMNEWFPNIKSVPVEPLTPPLPEMKLVEPDSGAVPATDSAPTPPVATAS